MPWTAFFLLLTSCSYPLIETQRTRNDITDLLVKKNEYTSLLEKSADYNSGYFKHHECDSLLYAGLLHAAGLDFDINQYTSGGGRWFRTPDHRCYGEGRSGSDISRDMFAGLFWSQYARKTIDLKSIYSYGFYRAWVMGRGSLDRTWMTPNFQNTLTLLMDKGEFVGENWIDPVKDHQRHIVLLNIILRGEIRNGITIEQYLLLKHLRLRMRDNALASFAWHRYTDGDQSETISILEKLEWFPDGRLPNSSDRCVEWMWVREVRGKYLRPCTPRATHSGGDFIFIAWLLDLSTR